jgi:hypothetical protein
VRIGTPGDFERDKAVATTYMGGLTCPWLFDAVTEKDNRVVRVA